VAVAAVLAFAIGIQTYVKRGLQARVKAGMDELINLSGTGDLVNLSNMAQYEPYYVNQNFDVTRDDTYTETTENGDISRTGFLSKTTRGAFVAGGAGFQEEKGDDALTEDDAWQLSTN
jgi:hypothetical protein